MAINGVGSGFASTSKTFTLAPPSGSNFLLFEVISETAADPATAISSSNGNVTWSVLTGPTLLVSEEGTFACTVFLGEVNSTASGTQTITTLGSPTIRAAGFPFSTTVGFASITLAQTGTASDIATFPPITPAVAGRTYFSFCYAETGTGAGSSAGYTYYIDPNSNPLCFNTNTPATAQAPNISPADLLVGIAVLVYEASTAVTATAALTVTPARSAARTRGQSSTAALTVIPARSAAASKTGAARTATAPLTVTPARSAARTRGQVARAALAVSPGRTASGSSGGASHAATAALTVTPARSAARTRGQAARAALTVAPARSAAASASGGTPHTATAALTVTPARSAAPEVGHHRTAALAVSPRLAATASASGPGHNVAVPGPPDGDPPFRWKVWL